MHLGRMEDYFEVIPSGTFEDGDDAYTLIVREPFTIHGVEVPLGTQSLFRVDANSELRASWMFNEGSIRNSQLDSTLIGSRRGSVLGNNIENSYLSSCYIKAYRVLLKHVDLNAVTTSIRVKFFGSLGSPEQTLIMSQVNHSMSVRMFNTSYSEFRKFTNEI